MNRERYFDNSQKKKFNFSSKRKKSGNSTYNSPENDAVIKSDAFEDTDGTHVKRTKFHHHENQTSSPPQRNRNFNKSQTRKSKGPDVPEKIEKDKKLLELVSYYEQILQSLKSGLPKEDTDIFVSNVLQESEGYEIKLSCHKFSSHCIELLLSVSKDPSICRQFMISFSSEKFEAFTNPNASHITELLLSISLQSIQEWASVLESDEDSVEKENTIYFISAITDFGEFIVENFSSCLENQFACHVVCTVIRTLGGDMSDATDFMSKRSANHKKDFRQQYVGENQSEATQPVVLEAIPKFFFKMLKKITKALLKIENIAEYATDSSCGTVIETLLCVTKKHIPKYCRKLIYQLAPKIFAEKNNNDIPHAFVHKNCSFIVEKMFHAADEELQLSLWNEYFADCLESLIPHHVGNYIIQRLFDVVENKSLFELMSEKIGNFFESILTSRHYGIFLSLAGACNRLKAQQSQFMKNIMHCLQCAEPEERQIHLAPLVMGLQTFDQPKAHVCLQGSLLAQAILKFQKPIKMVSSILNMKTQELADLACHIQGCHVLNAFFSSSTVGEKSKEKFIHCLKPSLVSLACDRNGSLTLSRIWVILSLKQRATMAQIFAQEERNLRHDRNGSILLQKFGIFHFKNNYENWKGIQNNLSNQNTPKT